MSRAAIAAVSIVSVLGSSLRGMRRGCRYYYFASWAIIRHSAGEATGSPTPGLCQLSSKAMVDLQDMRNEESCMPFESTG